MKSNNQIDSINQSNQSQRMTRIKITDIAGIRIGHAQDNQGGTGCTVIICEQGAPAGIDVRGGGPAARESELLKPVANADKIHAVVLGGGSAFGLDAAGGVMEYLEERNIGFDVGVTHVPLVCQSDLFDLTVADPKARPDKAMGYMACVASEQGNYQDGCFGAGTGATVGKIKGMEFCMKSGIGSFAVQIGELQLGAIVAVNALGDIYDSETGEQIAGLLTEDKTGVRSTRDEMYQQYQVIENKFIGAGDGCSSDAPASSGDGCSGDGCSGDTISTTPTNTTIGIIITNAKFDKTKLTKIAAVAHNGYARTINPVHTTADGDSIYAMSTGEIAADTDMVATLAADIMAKAVNVAVRSAESMYGYPSCKEIY